MEPDNDCQHPTHNTDLRKDDSNATLSHHASLATDAHTMGATVGTPMPEQHEYRVFGHKNPTLEPLVEPLEGSNKGRRQDSSHGTTMLGRIRVLYTPQPPPTREPRENKNLGATTLDAK